jgi:PmbA protein
MTKNLTALNTPAEQARWKNIVSDILREAQQQNATSAEVAVGTDHGFSVTVRMGEVETLEHHRDKGIDVTVYYGKRKGSASTNDVSADSIKSTVAAACRIAQLTSADEYAGLAEPQLMAKELPDCDLYHPWAITPEQAIEQAQACEEQARAVDKRIVNSDGATITTHQGLHVYGNSHGFIGSYVSSYHSLSCTLVAQDKEGMQRDGWYSVARDANDLEKIQAVARKAGERTIQRLGARKLKTCRAPVVFVAEAAAGLLGNFLGAISGGNLYRQASFLIDQLGKLVFAKHMQLHERPHVAKAMGSTPFDAEGVATHDRELVIDGVLQGYLLGSYSARKLGMQTTGNAGGAHNIYVESTLSKNQYQNNLNSQCLQPTHPLPLAGEGWGEGISFVELLKKMSKGLLVTETMGQGINLVTGDYSRGAVGFWIENGVVQYPVHEITIAGNLRDMFLNLVAVANDVDRRGVLHTGSILLDEMMIAGD